MFHLVAYLVKKHTLVEYNYKTYNKDLIFNIKEFKKKKLFLKFLKEVIKRLFSYKNWKYFTIIKLLNCY